MNSQSNDAFWWYVCPDGQLFFNSMMLSNDMYALTGNYFSIQQCFLMICMPWRAIVFQFNDAFYWYVCPNGQWFLYATMLSNDMYALTGNDFSLALPPDLYRNDVNSNFWRSWHDSPLNSFKFIGWKFCLC